MRRRARFAGRQSNTASLNLAAAGITPGKRGLVSVNAHYQSEVPNIYAAGDVVGPPALAATRTVRRSQITGIDLAINYWGSPWMAHPIASFQFADAPPVCFSIETRKEIGKSYSAIGGLYRQFELIYIVADKRDVIRVRTNYRRGEDVYLYRTTFTPTQARQCFDKYLRSLNQMCDRPRWYNAITTTARPASAHNNPLASEGRGTGASSSMAKATNSCKSAARSSPLACPLRS